MRASTSHPYFSSWRGLGLRDLGFPGPAMAFMSLIAVGARLALLLLLAAGQGLKA